MKPGDMISFEKDGVIHTERVKSVRYQSASPAIYRQLNRWQRVLRRITPIRFRTPLLVRPAEPSRVTINGDGNPVGKTLAQLEQMKADLDKMLG